MWDWEKQNQKEKVEHTCVLLFLKFHSTWFSYSIFNLQLKYGTIQLILALKSAPLTVSFYNHNWFSKCTHKDNLTYFFLYIIMIVNHLADYSVLSHSVHMTNQHYNKQTHRQPPTMHLSFKNNTEEVLAT